jgi:hypothetical protein
MPSPDLNHCRRILEVSPQATREEITHAYQQLKHIHGAEPGLAIASSMEEFAPEARLEVLEEIEAAYALLRASPEPEAPAPIPIEEEPPPAVMTGLRQARTAAHLTLDQVAQETCVRREYLQALEEECFEELRLLAPVAVRGYLTAFAQAVDLPHDPFVLEYMKRFTAPKG